MMNLRKRAAATLEDVSVASVKVGNAADWAGVTLVVVAGVALVALLVAVIALERASNDR